MPCYREYLLFIINIIIKKGVPYIPFSIRSFRVQFSGDVYYTNFARLETDVARSFYQLSFFFRFIFFFLMQSESRNTFHICSFSFSLSQIITFSHSFSFSKSCNLQLLYNMTENTLDHDNTIIIVLFFIFFLLPFNFICFYFFIL